jgi:two-component system, OmpR family, copper resistance phosphate regulon response regulator CusR
MRVLVVEDDARLATLAAEFLVRHGFAVDTAATGARALDLAQGAPYDAVVLDLMLPDMDGFAVARTLRRHAVPPRILMATARDAVEDRVSGLDLGADDYLVKPYALAELVARIRALLRRPADALPPVLTVGELTLDTARREAARRGRRIALTTKEFAVLEFLMRHPGAVVTRDRLSAHAWDDNYDPASNVIDVYIARLRRKVDADGEAAMFETIRGAGYRLTPA